MMYLIILWYLEQLPEVELADGTMKTQCV